MGTNLCIFCLRKLEIKNSKLNDNDDESDSNCLETSLKLLQRYINSSTEHAPCTFLSGNDTNSLGSCQDCLYLLEEFHKFYFAIRLLEMKLNWRLDMLLSKMTSAENLQSRTTETDLKNEFENKRELFEKLRRFRQELAEKTSKKLKSAYPKLKLKRSKSPKEPTLPLALPQFLPNTSVLKNLKHEKPLPDLELHSNLMLEISEPFFRKEKEEPIHEIFEEDFQTMSFEEPTQEVCHEWTKENGKCIDSDETLPSPQLPNSITEAAPIATEEMNRCEKVDDTHMNSEVAEAPLNMESVLLEENSEPDLENDSDHDWVPDLQGVSDSEEDEESSTETESNNFDLVLNESICLNAEDAPEKEEENIDKDVEVNPLTPVQALRRSKRKLSNSSFTKAENKIPKVTPDIKIKTEKFDIASENAAEYVPPYTKASEESKTSDSEQNITETNFVPLTLQQLALKRIMAQKNVCKTYPCESKTFWNPIDFKSHLQHHAEFRCNFCEFVSTYAPNLWKHENSQHLPKSQKMENGKSSWKCPRCDYKSPRSSTTMNHFLKSHLNLTPDRNTCPICKKCLTFLLYKTLPDEIKNHFETHHDLSKSDQPPRVKLACDVQNCGAFFRTEEQLHNHRKRLHLRSYKCDMCSKRFKTESLLKNHHVSEHSNGSWSKLRKPSKRCPKCKKLVRAVDFNGHLNKHKFDDNWLADTNLRPGDHQLFASPIFCKSSNCKRSFYKEEDLQFHLKHHGEFKCNFCHLVFDYAGKLPLHEMAHNKKPPQKKDSKDCFFCSRCEFSTTTRKHYICHFTESHLCMTADYRSCPICNTRFYSNEANLRKSLLNHLSIHHDFMKKIYSCNEDGCRAYFNSKFQLDLHGNSHKYDIKITAEGNRRLECKIGGCKSSFHSRKNYNSHYNRFHRESKDLSKDEDLKKEEDKEKVMCNECGKILRNQSGLRLHLINVHPTKPPKRRAKRTYVCHECGKSFKFSVSLELHSYSHSGPESWKFECITCSKRCMTKQKLDEHMRTHSKEKPFACEHCGISYAHRHNLRIHINNKHGDVGSDPARKFDNSRLVSRKGIKLKKSESQGESAMMRANVMKKRRGRPRKQRRFSTSSSESDHSD